MIRHVKSLYKKALAHIVPPAGGDGKELDARTIVRRRVEVTVERETVSLLVPGQPRTSADRTVAGCGDPEGEPPRLPPRNQQGESI